MFSFKHEKRMFLKKSFRFLKGVMFASPSLFYINKLAAKPVQRMPSSIEEYTEGKIKDNDLISAENVGQIASLLDPATFNEIRNENRNVMLSPAGLEEDYYPPYFHKMTLENKDKFIIDNQNKIVSKEGLKWRGGLPFPKSTKAIEIAANLTHGSSRHDQEINAINGALIDDKGRLDKSFDMVFAEQKLDGICNPIISEAIKDKTKYKHLLKYTSVWFTAPKNIEGLAFTSKWFKDQNKFPELFSFNPKTKRMTKLANFRRLSSLIPNMNFSLSDNFGFDDPFGVWGRWNIVYTGPFLVSAQHNWRPDLPNWDIPVTGGQRGQTYYLVRKQYIPNIVVVDVKPTGYRNPSFMKKRIYIDGRNMTPSKVLYYDQNHNITKSIEIGYSQLKIDPLIQPTIRNQPILTDLKKADWNWSWYMCKDHRRNNISRFHLAESCAGGWRTISDNLKDNGDPEQFIEKHMTQKGIRELFS